MAPQNALKELRPIQRRDPLAEFRERTQQRNGKEWGKIEKRKCRDG